MLVFQLHAALVTEWWIDTSAQAHPLRIVERLHCALPWADRWAGAEEPPYTCSTLVPRPDFFPW